MASWSLTSQDCLGSSNNRWRRPVESVVSPRVREDSVHTRLESGASVRPLNFTVCCHIGTLI
jgi:hypothetical protein